MLVWGEGSDPIDVTPRREKKKDTTPRTTEHNETQKDNWSKDKNINQIGVLLHGYSKAACNSSNSGRNRKSYQII